MYIYNNIYIYIPRSYILSYMGLYGIYVNMYLKKSVGLFYRYTILNARYIKLLQIIFKI